MGNLSNESPLLFSEIYLLMPTRQQLNASLHHPFLCEEGEGKNHGQRTRGAPVSWVLWHLQRILQDHLDMEKNLQQDNPSSHPSTILHLPSSYANIPNDFLQDP